MAKRRPPAGEEADRGSLAEADPQPVRWWAVEEWDLLPPGERLTRGPKL
jgi:hypothetical protein